MDLPVQRFYQRVKTLIEREGDLPDLFTYHLTVEMTAPVATVSDIRGCYQSCDLPPPSWLASHFSKGLKSSPRRFIKRDGGYRLEARRREAIEKLLGDSQPDIHISGTLSRLEDRIKSEAKREYLHETIKCFGVGAHRAATVMCWNLALFHLHDFILQDQASHHEFNAALAANTDSRVKIKVVNKLDDFTEIPEGRFLTLCREAKILTSSMFNKLQGRLHERNSAAHPSGVRATPKSTEAYIEDLVENVLMKFETT